jgi:hypothetical protein
MNRVTAVLLAAVALAGAVAAQAQPEYPRVSPYLYTAPPIAPGDMANYCVYDNRVYSLGSGLCFGRAAFVCVASQGPATGSRAFWTSKEDTVFGRPTCG